MSEKLAEYLSEYIKGRTGVFKKYLLDALENKDKCILYLESSEGTIIPSSDLKNCELLRDAQLFTEDVKTPRHGRNIYKVYCLTDLGKKIAEAIKQKDLDAEDKEKSAP